MQMHEKAKSARDFTSTGRNFCLNPVWSLFIMASYRGRRSLTRMRLKSSGRRAITALVLESMNRICLACLGAWTACWEIDREEAAIGTQAEELTTNPDHKAGRRAVTCGSGFLLSREASRSSAAISQLETQAGLTKIWQVERISPQFRLNFMGS